MKPSSQIEKDSLTPAPVSNIVIFCWMSVANETKNVFFASIFTMFTAPGLRQLVFCQCSQTILFIVVFLFSL